MKRIWNLALGTAVLCAALLCGCTFNGSTAPAGSAPADPLTGQELQYPGERTAVPRARFQMRFMRFPRY